MTAAVVKLLLQNRGGPSILSSSYFRFVVDDVIFICPFCFYVLLGGSADEMISCSCLLE